jgi:cytosine/adenosine deaminase-related metal-dependent hydrolase
VFVSLCSGPDARRRCAALEIATRGGAAVLGRDDIARSHQDLQPDIVAFDLEAIGYAGQHDPGRGAAAMRADECRMEHDQWRA